MNNRRKFLAALSVGAIVAARPVYSQSRPFQISWFSGGSLRTDALFFDAFGDELRKFGYVEGRNLVLQALRADGSSERLDQLAVVLVRTRPDVIVTVGPAVLALRRAGATTPVVFGFSGNPVEAKIVEGFPRPGSNYTGISFLTLELVSKRMEMMKEILPRLKRVAVVAQPLHPGDLSERRASQTAATALGLELDFFEMRGVAQLEGILGAIQKARSEAVVWFPVASLMSASPQIAAWSVTNRIASISGWATFADGGNLMSYGPNLRESFQRLAYFVDRILKGAKPSELPVELPTRVEFVVNLKAATTLGIKIPGSILVRADRVIE